MVVSSTQGALGTGKAGIGSPWHITAIYAAPKTVTRTLYFGPQTCQGLKNKTKQPIK